MLRPPNLAGLPALVAGNLILVAAYVFTGFAGLQLAFVGHVVTLFWPPSGLAFAAVWLGGLGLLPGVFLGALAVNLIAMGSPLLAVTAGLGNTLSALAGVLVLRRLAARGRTPTDLRQVIAFLLVPVFGSTLISATIGAAAVSATGLPAADSPASVFAVWWLGDAMGVLLVAPPILFARRWTEHRWTPALAAEAAVFVLAWGVTVAALVLAREPAWAPELCKLFSFVLCLWAGARFGLHGATAMTLLMAAGAAGATMAGVGPFVRGDFYETFSLLHSYLLAQALAAILLAASLADTRRTVIAERAARAEAEAAAASQFRLLTTISHDVRTPLNGLMGVLQTLAGGAPPKEQKRLVELGLRSGRTLTALVADLLDSARVQSGRLQITLAPFSPAASLDDLVRLAGVAAEEKKLSLTLEGGESIPDRVVGDRVRFEQVIGNLIANAIAYTAAGEVCVTADWRAASGRPLVVEVTDTGPGVPPELASRIFEPYVRGSLEARGQNAQAHESLGLGLGLDISRRLARAMGGDLSFSPRAGGGSAFRLELPFVAEAALSAAPIAAVRLQEAPMAILLVDDDAIGGEVTAALLTSRGHRVVTVGDEAAALEAFGDQAFDLVLADVRLAGGASGLDVVRRLRALPARSDRLRIMAFTADAFGDEALYRAAGVDGVVIKPLDVQAGLGPILGAG